MADRPAQLSNEESLLKKSDRAAREIEKLLKDSDDRLSFNGLNLAKRYVEGDLEIAIRYCGAGGHSDNSSHHIFVKACGGRHFDQARLVNGLYAKIEAGIEHRRSDWNYGFVKVGVSEIVEGPKKVVPSAVWFEPANHAPGIFSEYLFFFLGSLTFKYLLVSGDRKVGASSGVPVFYCEGSRKMIQRRSGIAEGVANAGVERPRQGPDKFDLEPLLRRLNVDVSPNGIRLGFKEGPNLGGHIFDVAIGPFNL